MDTLKSFKINLLAYPTKVYSAPKSVWGSQGGANRVAAQRRIVRAKVPGGFISNLSGLGPHKGGNSFHVESIQNQCLDFMRNFWEWGSCCLVDDTRFQRDGQVVLSFETCRCLWYINLYSICLCGSRTAVVSWGNYSSKIVIICRVKAIPQWHSGERFI